MKLGIDRNTAWKVAYTGRRIAYVCNKGAVNHRLLLDWRKIVKISRWSLIKALKGRMLISCVYGLFTLSCIGAGVWGIYKIVEKVMQRGDGLRFLKLEENWWMYILFGGAWLFMIYAHCLYVERGFLLDIILLPVKRLPEVSRSVIMFPAKTQIYDWNYAAAYWVEIRRNKKDKPLQLYVNKNLGLIPKGAKYDIYYLKYSKMIVKADILEGKKKPQAKEVVLMEPAVIPQYSTEKLKAMTKIHSWRSKLSLVLCMAGAVVLVVWGLYSTGDIVYWYQLETERCVSIWITFLLAEIFFIILFRKIDRGCLRDVYCGEICVTEVISIADIYGKRFWNDIDRKLRDRIRGIELEVVDGIHKNERFILYKEFSEYWNCFPMCAHLHWRFRGKRFEAGAHKLKAVRIYYLKHSGIVVKLDVRKESC